MNATVQCLKTVPELKEALQKFEGGNMYSLFIYFLTKI